MKNLITILILLVAAGCGKSLKEEKVVGSYEVTFSQDAKKVYVKNAQGTKEIIQLKPFTFKYVFLENGKFEFYFNGEKDDEGTWKIVGKEVHAGSEKEREVLKVELNGDLISIARIKDSKREETKKINQTTWKKLK